MRKYQVTLTGMTDVLMHADNLIWREQIEAWRKDPLNKKKSKAGDDRMPAWSWIGYLYHDGKHIGIPSDNLMTCLRDGAAQVVISGKKTFKSQSQSGMLVNEVLWPITRPDGELVEWAPIEALVNDPDFEKHQKVALENGFELFIKPAKIGQAKHVRVRPRFSQWTCTGTITVFDDMITKAVLEQILFSAGNYCGLCDWRPKSPKAPGQFGKFSTTIKEIK